jgi:hypothetical protein
MSILAVAILVFQNAEPAAQPEVRRRGPIVVHPQYPTDALRPIPLVDPRDVVADGEWQVSLHADWANSYGRDFDPITGDLLFLVDAETVETSLEARRGLGNGWEIGLLARADWRGGGILDGLINDVHEAIGMSSNIRDHKGEGLYDFVILGRRFRRGWGIADPILFARRQWIRTEESPWRISTRLSVRLPAADDDFGAAMADLMASAQASYDISRRLSLYAGLTAQEGLGNDDDPLSFHRFRWGAFGALAWNIHPNVELIGQAMWASQFLTEPDRFDRTTPYAGLGVRWMPGDACAIEIAAFENLTNMRTTADIAFRIGISISF